MDKLRTYLTAFSVVFFGSVSLMAQTINSSEGGEAILNNGTGLFFDLKDEKISFEVNNFSKSTKLIPKNDGLLVGMKVSTANSSSTGFLFKGGDYQATSKLGGTFGYFWSNRDSLVISYNKVNKDLINKLEVRRKMSISIDKLLMVDSQLELADILTDKQLKTYSTEEKEKFLSEYQDTVRYYLKNGVDEDGFPRFSYEMLLKQLKKDYDVGKAKSEDEKKAKFMTDLLTGIEKRIKEGLILLNSTVKEIKAENDKLKASILGPYWRFSLFGFGGINAESFKLYNTLDTNNFNKSFSQIYSRGSYAGVGININLPQGEIVFFKNDPKKRTSINLLGKNLILGIKYTYSEVSNFGLLSKESFKFTQTHTNNSGQSLIQTKEIAAYTGSYTKLYENRLNFDLIRIFNFDSISVAANLYVINKKVNRTDLLPETTDAGVSLSFFKPSGKFMGGFYLEVPDWDDNLEDIKETPNYRDRKNRMTFGVYATYTFSSLFNSELFVPKGE